MRCRLVGYMKKGKSAIHLARVYGERKQNFVGQHFWARGYFVSTAAQAGGANRCAFLDMLAVSEIGAELLAETDNGYNVLVGATPAHPLTFPSYATHPSEHLQCRMRLRRGGPL
jgi:hypothetical protein